MSGAAGLTFGTTTLAAAAVIDASANSGTNTISVGSGQQYIGGTGTDVVTANNGVAQTKTVDGGAGSADKLILGNVTDFGTTAAAAKFLNFEVLQTTVSADVSKFTGSAITSESMVGTISLTGLNATQAANITITGNSTPTIGVTGSTSVGQLDTVGINVNDGSSTVNTLTLTAPVLAGVETLNLTATDNVVVTALTSATALTNITVTGAGTSSITTGVVALNVNTVIDASAATGAVTVNAVASTTNGLKIIGSATKANTLTGNALSSILTGGAAADTITGGAAADVISAGEGNNTIAGGGGADVITAGNGNNTISGFSGGTVTVGNGYNIITGGAGADTIVVGTGGNVITGAAGADKITFGAHVAGVMDGIVLSAAAETYSAATAGTIVSGTTALTGIDLVTGLKAGDTIDVSAVAAITGTAGTTIAAAAGTTASLVRGNFDATTSIWTTSATGTDTLFVYDIDGAGANTVVEAIALIGVVATGVAAAGVLSLA